MNRWLGMPELASAHGGEIDRLMLILHVFMVLFFASWLLFGFYILIRFRRGKNPKADYKGTHTHATHVMEFAIIAFEFALLILISVPFWNKYVIAQPELPENAVEVRVLAQQFVWNVHYPGADGIFGQTDINLVDDATNPVGLDRESEGAADDIVSVNNLYLPVDRPAVIHLTSKDVIHSFGVPEFRVKQDAIPGMEALVQFTPTVTTNDFRARKAGKTPEEFAAWAEETKNAIPQIVKEQGVDAAVAVQNELKRTFEIACAQLCGLGHFRMIGFVHVLDQTEYETWLEENAPSENEDPFAEF